MPKSSIDTFKEAIDAYETSLNQSNAGAIEAQLSKPLGNRLQDAQRQSYLAIVKMCEYLNSWKGAANPAFLKSVQKDLDSIQARIDKNAALRPFAYLVAYARGFVFRGQGLHKEAFAAFEKSAEFNRDFFRADAQMAAQQIYLDQLPEAERLIKLAISKTPPTSPAFANEKWTAGRIQFFLGDYRGAIELLKESKEADDGRWYITAHLCSALSYIEQHKDAEQLLTELEKRFEIKTIQDVFEREKLNPTAGSTVVEAGRRRLHGGLIKAGLDCVALPNTSIEPPSPFALRPPPTTR